MAAPRSTASGSAALGPAERPEPTERPEPATAGSEVLPSASTLASTVDVMVTAQQRGVTGLVRHPPRSGGNRCYFGGNRRAPSSRMFSPLR